MEKTEMMREEIKRRIHDVENELKALKELVDSEAFAPKEPDLTEFEQELACVVCEWGDSKETKISNYVLIHSGRLLELAKKEICKGCTVGLDQYWKGYEEAMKAKKHDTFSCPTYEPPCFHGGVCIDPFKDCINCPRTGGDIGISTTSGTCKRED